MLQLSLKLQILALEGLFFPVIELLHNKSDPFKQVLIANNTNFSLSPKMFVTKFSLLYHHVMSSSKTSLKSVMFNFHFFFLINWFNTTFANCKATFYNRTRWNWSIDLKDAGSWRVTKKNRNQKIICFI